MIITKTIHIKNKIILNVIGSPIVETDPKPYHIEKCLVTTIRVFGIPVYQRTEVIPPLRHNIPNYDNLDI